MLEESARAAAHSIAEAEYRSYLAAEQMKEAERIYFMAENTESMMQLANEILEQCNIQNSELFASICMDFPLPFDYMLNDFQIWQVQKVKSWWWLEIWIVWLELVKFLRYTSFRYWGATEAKLSFAHFANNSVIQPLQTGPGVWWYGELFFNYLSIKKITRSYIFLVGKCHRLSHVVLWLRLLIKLQLYTH